MAFCGNMCIPKNFNSAGRRCETDLCIVGKIFIFFPCSTCSSIICFYAHETQQVLIYYPLYSGKKHNLYTFAQCTHFVCTYHVLFYFYFSKLMLHVHVPDFESRETMKRYQKWRVSVLCVGQLGGKKKKVNMHVEFL